MKLSVFIVIFSLIVTTSCRQDCMKVVDEYANGEKKVEHHYTDCSDTTSYKRIFFYENGQIGSESNVLAGYLEGLCKGWNENGIQIEEWYMQHGEEHGPFQCWYDNGVKGSESFQMHGKLHGTVTNWHENGELASKGAFEEGEKVGTWEYFEENGDWYRRNYLKGQLEGRTNERVIDSTGEVSFVVGQYENGQEVGLWKWFDADSLLELTGNYISGESTGEFVEYYKDGTIRMSGNLVKGLKEGPVKYFDADGNLTHVEEYENGIIKTN